MAPCSPVPELRWLLLLLGSSTLAVEHHHLHPQPKPRHELGSDVPLLSMPAPLPLAPPPPLLRAAATTNASAAERSAGLAGCFEDSFRFGFWKASPLARSPFKRALKAKLKEPDTTRAAHLFSPFCASWQYSNSESAREGAPPASSRTGYVLCFFLRLRARP